jgi:hypothetical protein
MKISKFAFLSVLTISLTNLTWADDVQEQASRTENRIQLLENDGEARVGIGYQLNDNQSDQIRLNTSVGRNLRLGFESDDMNFASTEILRSHLGATVSTEFGGGNNSIQIRALETQLNAMGMEFSNLNESGRAYLRALNATLEHNHQQVGDLVYTMTGLNLALLGIEVVGRPVVNENGGKLIIEILANAANMHIGSIEFDGESFKFVVSADFSACLGYDFSGRVDLTLCQSWEYLYENGGGEEGVRPNRFLSISSINLNDIGNSPIYANFSYINEDMGILKEDESRESSNRTFLLETGFRF